MHVIIITRRGRNKGGAGGAKAPPPNFSDLQGFRFLKVHEDLVGLAYMETTDSSTIKSVLQDCLMKCSIQISYCQGQAYDGPANMAGHLNGVAAKIRQDEPRAHFVHCVTHLLNLCLQQSGK